MSNVNEQMLQSGFAAGGMKQDPVSGNEVPVGALPHEVRDDVDAKLSEGEFVIPADVVRFIGLQKLMQLRDKAKEGLARMAEMGQVGNSDEAKANGEDPLGKFDEDEEDDDGFEAEIDDIMGGEVEMATGGSVPGATTITGQNTGGDNAWLWKPTEQNTRYFGYDPTTGKWGDGTESFMSTARIEPEVEKYLRAIGYTGKLHNEQAFRDYSVANTPGGEAGSGYAAAGGRSAAEARTNAITAGWQPDTSVWNPNERNTELDQFLADKGLKLEVGVHQVPNASQKTIIQRVVGADGKPVAVDAFNDRYDASDRWGDFTKAAILAAMGAAAMGYGSGATAGADVGHAIGSNLGGVDSAANIAGGLGETAAAGTGSIKYLDPALAGTKPVVTTPGLTATDIGFGSIGPGGGFTAGLGGTTPLQTLPTSLDPSLLDRAKDYAVKKVTDPVEIAKTAGKEVLKDAIGGGKGSSVPSWLVGAGLGAAAGSAASGGSSSTESSKTEVPRGNNPVVDYRPAGDQMEELFINNRPTGKKKKKGFAAGGDVNLDAYNFFNQQD